MMQLFVLTGIYGHVTLSGVAYIFCKHRKEIWNSVWDSII